VDETYIKVKGEWKYLYRAVDSQGNTLDFMLSAKRDARAAERFFRKVLKSTHNQKPRVINVDKNAAYPPAIDELKKDQTLPETTELRPVKYLNNIVELFAPSAQTIGQSRNGVWLVQYSETNVERL
jgi:transposase-like protein